MVWSPLEPHPPHQPATAHLSRRTLLYCYWEEMDVVQSVPNSSIEASKRAGSPFFRGWRDGRVSIVHAE